MHMNRTSERAKGGSYSRCFDRGIICLSLIFILLHFRFRHIILSNGRKLSESKSIWHLFMDLIRLPLSIHAARAQGEGTNSRKWQERPLNPDLEATASDLLG